MTKFEHNSAFFKTNIPFSDKDVKKDPDFFTNDVTREDLNRQFQMLSEIVGGNKKNLQDKTQEEWEKECADYFGWDK